MVLQSAHYTISYFTRNIIQHYGGGAIVLKRCQDGFTDKIMETCKSTYVAVNCSKLNVLSHFKGQCSGYQAKKVSTIN